MLKGITAAAVTLASYCAGCVYVSIPSELSVGADGPFVMGGPAEAIEDNGSCFVWDADDGTTFVLFRNPNLKSADFSRVISPRTRSRLSLTVRDDLGFLDEPCYPGSAVVQVVKLLEITN